MKKFVKKQHLFVMGMVLALSILLLNACKREQFTQTTTEDVNITGYLEKYPESFSLMTEILERSGTAGYLGAYGEYTLFTPNNNAVKAWLVTKGKSQISDIDVNELKDFVKYHLVKDTLSTGRFTDGKINTLTLFGQYLYTSVDQATSNYIINKQSLVLKSNIITGNGLIHVLNKVLIPPTKTLAKEIETNPRYKIFSDALKATGFYDSLNYELGAIVDTSRKFQTVIAESDSIFATKNIFTLADLKTSLKSTNPTNHKDSLWLYVAYHISPGANYLSDIKSLTALYTLAPKEIVTTKLDKTNVLLNDDEFNGVKEPGVLLNKNHSDLMASNGVVHDANGSFKIKVRQQVPIYWDVAEQPELIAALGSSYRSAATITVPLIMNGGSITSSMTFENPTALAADRSRYATDHATAVGSSRVSHGEDRFVFSMGGPSRQQWIEMKTPFLVKGKYKVWVCYAQNGSGPVTQLSMDNGTSQEQVLPTLVNFTQGLDASGVATSASASPTADNLMMSQGFKRYIAHSNEYVTINGIQYRGQKPQTGTGWQLNIGRLAGVVDVQTTDRHRIRFTYVSGAWNDVMWLDMIHFIPVDDSEGKYPLVGNVDQMYPRFHTNPAVRFPRP